MVGKVTEREMTTGEWLRSAIKPTQDGDWFFSVGAWTSCAYIGWKWDELTEESFLGLSTCAMSIDAGGMELRSPPHTT